MGEVLEVTFHGEQGPVTKKVNRWMEWREINDTTSAILNTEYWCFKYEDDDGDSICGSSELEWRSVCDVATKVPSLDVHVYPLKRGTMSGCCGGATPVASSEETTGGSDDPNRKPGLCCSENIQDGNICCPAFARPIPNEPEFDEKPPIKIVNPLLPQYKYTTESLRAVACPLGPLGGGSVAIAGDGGLRQWQISNKVNHLAQVPNSFFAIKVGEVAAVLQSNTWYDQQHFKPSPYISDHVVPPESKKLLSQVPGVKTVEITAKYPVVEVDYKDASLKDIVVHLETWSPKVPLNVTDSAIPLIVFDFHVTNKRPSPHKISLLGSMQNIIGWDGLTPIEDEVKYQGYGFNTNSLYTTQSMYGIKMTNTNIPSTDEKFGHISLLSVREDSDHLTTMLQYYQVKDLWDAFSKGDCLPGQGVDGVSISGSTFNGAVANTRTLGPGERTVFTYLMFWHIPNRYRDWRTWVSIPNTPLWVGNQYAKIWPTIDNMITYVSNKLSELRKWTYKFRDSMFNSSLPWQLIDSAAGRVSVLNSPSCMWHHDGYFYAFEGCSPKNGCCPLNCTHVWNYEMTLSNLFPSLERTMREIDLLRQITPHGVVPSRTECPLQLERAWNKWKNYEIDPRSTQICVDGEIGTVFKTYREMKFGAPRKWCLAMWEPVKRVMRHWLDVLDTEKNGLVYGPQPNTFDRCCYGYLVIFGALYLCGLRAAEEMAKILGDQEFESVCHKRFQLGSSNLDRVCFTNGKWYTQEVDPQHNVQVLSDCTFVGALYGQWWAHLLGLGYLLPKQHIASHLQYTYTRNFVASWSPAIQYPRKFCDERDSGWILGKWDGEIPKNALLYSNEAAWSGVLYPFASLLIMEGLTKQGLDVLQRNRYLYDGTRRSPWNEIECGDHYTRPMSSWSLFQTASGLQWSIMDDNAVKLSFNPTIDKLEFSGFFVLGTCWGTYRQHLNTVDVPYARIEVDYGELRIASVTLHVPWSSLVVQVEKFTVPFALELDEKAGCICVRFEKVLHLQCSQAIDIRASF